MTRLLPLAVTASLFIACGPATAGPADTAGPEALAATKATTPGGTMDPGIPGPHLHTALVERTWGHAVAVEAHREREEAEREAAEQREEWAREAAEVVAPVGSVPAILWRIARCEGYPGYVHRDHGHSTSTASGKYGFLDSTWVRWRPPEAAGYARAFHAPEHLQDAAAVALYNARGTQPWNASRGCWG